MAVAVINHAAFCGERNLPLLLVLSLLYECSILEELQINQSPADRHAPQEDRPPQQVEPPVLAEVGITGRHKLHFYVLSFRIAQRGEQPAFLLARINSRFLVAFAPRNDKTLDFRQRWRTTFKVDRQNFS